MIHALLLIWKFLIFNSRNFQLLSSFAWTYKVSVWELLNECLNLWLRQALSQPWEHRWRQFRCVTWRGGAWLHLSSTLFKGLLSGDRSYWSFSCESMMCMSIFRIFLIIIFLAILFVDTDLTTPLCMFVDYTVFILQLVLDCFLLRL